MTTTINHDADSARLAIAEQLSIIRTLLRLLDPASPFQPILVGSIDLVGWQASFGQAAEAIEALLPPAIAPLPKHTRDKITAAASPLFSLAHSICDAPRDHMSQHAADLHARGLLPDFVGLDPDPDRSPEEETLVEEALAESGQFLQQSAQQFALLRNHLATSAQQLVNTLTRKHGLLWLLRRGVKKSKQFGGKFQQIADAWESFLAPPPPPPNQPWNDARRWFAGLATTFEVHALAEIDAILRGTVPRTARAGRTPATSTPPSRQSIKNSCLRSWESFFQTYTAACNIAAAESACPLWRLFTGLTGALSSSLTRAGVLDDPAATPPADDRVVEGLTRLDQRIIARSLLARWNQTLIAEDDYALQIVLAGLHHLERPADDDGSTAGKHGRLVYDFSEEAMARWLSRRAYAGVNPDLEASGKFSTETRRTRRALEHLRSNQAAFHGRRHWSPLPNKVPETASDRFWTVNPLLAVHPQIRDLIARSPATSAAVNPSRETRRRPSRRNRGLRQ